MNLKKEIAEKYYSHCEDFINRYGKLPETAFVAGSGIAAAINKDWIINRIGFDKFPLFPAVSVLGHAGEILILNINQMHLLLFSGRFHYYEGNSLENVCSQVLFSYFAGIKNIIFTNAAGGLNPDYKPGELMIINNFINFTNKNIYSLFEESNPEYYVNNHNIIDSNISSKIEEYLTIAKTHFHKGTYLSVTGPSYETRSEIKMMRLLRADAVGMSTYFEAAAASMLGMNVAACSLITNSAKEITQSVSHEEVTDVANKSTERVKKLIEAAAHL